MTIKELAMKARVSPKTVSRVINNEKYVNIDTRERILKIIKDF